MQSTLRQMLENEVTIQKDVEAWIPPLIHTETRIEGIQVWDQLEHDAGQRGNPVSQLALASSCRNTDALQLVAESRNYHKVFLDELVLLDGAHQGEKLLRTQG